MTKSKLTDVTIISPNTSGIRTAEISKVTVHHMAGDLSVEQCGSIFASASRQASSNYGVGSDGRIGCYLEEEYHPWTSASYWNDDRAITLEVADYDLEEWSPSRAAYESTVNLCADICTRYGIEPNYTGDQYGTFTEHRMFAATSCPAEWWHEKLSSGEFIEDVKQAMNGRYGVPMECILHPDESGTLFYVCGMEITHLDNPDQMKAVDKLGDKCGTSIPHVEMGTKAAPWGWRFFQACGKEDLYDEYVRGR